MRWNRYFSFTLAAFASLLAYFSATTVKYMLNIASADTADDAKIAALGAQADSLVDDSLYQWADTLPFTGGDITSDLTLASNAWVCYIYRGDNPEASKWHAIFADTISRIKQRLGVTQGRVQIIATQNFRTYPLNPDATPYRSITGGNNSVDDSDLTS